MDQANERNESHGQKKLDQDVVHFPQGPAVGGWIGETANQDDQGARTGQDQQRQPDLSIHQRLADGKVEKRRPRSPHAWFDYKY